MGFVWQEFQYAKPSSGHGSYVNAPKSLTTTNTVYNKCHSYIDRDTQNLLLAAFVPIGNRWARDELNNIHAHTHTHTHTRALSLSLLVSLTS